MARVTTIEGTLQYATRAPLQTPARPPIAHAAKVAVQTPPSGWLLATRPATTLAIAKTEPTEMSISPVIITTVAPSATTATGRLASSRSMRFSEEKYDGDTVARTAASTAMARATVPSRRYANVIAPAPPRARAAPCP